MTRLINITEHQLCTSHQPYHQMFAQSDSDPKQFYTLLIVEPYDPPEKWVCTCKSWYYNGGPCKHAAKVTPCYWRESEGPERQTSEQKRANICPRCFRPTTKELVSE